MLQDWLSKIGLPSEYLGASAIVVKSIVLLLLGLLVYHLAKAVLLKLVGFISKSTKNNWDDKFVAHKVFNKVAHFAPGFLFYFAAPVLFASTNRFLEFSSRITGAYLTLIICMVLIALLNSIGAIYDQYKISREKPIRAYLQACKIIVYFLSSLFIIAVLLDKSPWGFISVLGGLTAVLLLVFKDMILGLVAGIQLSSNNMVAKGDWVEMPKYGADGEVLEITLTTVMVQNWDKTISTIPAYALISDSFKNWKGMEQSQGRRIKRAFNIDVNSIKFVDVVMLEKFRKFEFLHDYIEQKLEELEQYNKEVDVSALINGRRLTNVGTLRAYIVNYLQHHPEINKEMTFLVRQLAPSSEGLPIEIYVFCKDKRWANYEAIQADIFDHILASVQEFDLRLFQQPSGADFSRLNG